MIVTSNLVDFPPGACDPYDVDVQTPDEFLSYQWEIEDPDYLLAVLETWAANLKKPPQTLEELLVTLGRVVPRFSEKALESVRERQQRN